MVTEFQNRVFDALKRVPRGRVVTYKILAAMVGCRSTRAIGQAVRRNPYAPQVPCHRVIASDLRLGGYAGALRGARVARKRRLLASEGVQFLCGRLADAARVYEPEPGFRDE